MNKQNMEEIQFFLAYFISRCLIYQFH